MAEDNDNVVEFNGITRLDIPPERVLRAALEKGLTEVVIVGFKSDGSEYFAASCADGANTLWHLERAKLKLLNTVDEEK